MADEMPFSERLRQQRQRAGMSRPVLGGLVGRSGEWVKALETGRLMTPRPAEVAALVARVGQMWDLWHGARRHRTAIATLLPTLLKDARLSVRRADGSDRRKAQAAEAQAYHLAQLFLAYQPVPELVALTSDRAMMVAQDADNPLAIAAAAWYANHRFRTAGMRHEARIELALETVRLLDPERVQEERALWGLLHLAVALSYAKVGHEGNAWRYWDEADRAARAG